MARSGDTLGAIAAFQALADANPDDFDSRVWLGRLLTRIGRRAEADHAPARRHHPFAATGRRARRARRRAAHQRARRRRLRGGAGRRGAAAEQRRRPGAEGPHPAAPRPAERGLRRARRRTHAQPARRGHQHRPRAHPSHHRAPGPRRRRAGGVARRHPRGVDRRRRRRRPSRRRASGLRPRPVAGSRRPRRHPGRRRHRVAAGPPRARAAARVLVSPGSPRVARADLSGELEFAAGRTQPAIGVRYLDFAGARVWILAPSISVDLTDNVAVAARYYRSESEFLPVGQRAGNNSGAIMARWQAARRLSLSARLCPRQRELRHPVGRSARALPRRHGGGRRCASICAR